MYQESVYEKSENGDRDKDKERQKTKTKKSVCLSVCLSGHQCHFALNPQNLLRWNLVWRLCWTRGWFVATVCSHLFHYVTDPEMSHYQNYWSGKNLLNRNGGGGGWKQRTVHVSLFPFLVLFVFSCLLSFIFFFFFKLKIFGWQNARLPKRVRCPWNHWG